MATMETTWDKLDGAVTPTLETMAQHVQTPFWGRLLAYLESAYAAQPSIEYSRCKSLQGWHVKFKKAGKSLCILYPDAGFFTTLVVISQREKPEAELALPTLSPYTQQLYASTEEGMGQRWLLFVINSEEILQDVKTCIALRRKPT